MTLKKLLMAGIFVLMAGNGAIAVAYQTAAPTDANGKIELISSYCSQHPQRCHRNRHTYSYWDSDNWYHKDDRHWAKHCRHHPYREGCQRFCHLNRDVCYH